MRIDIVSDVICPWCYIGKRRLERALAQDATGDAEIEWHPFQLNPDMPPEGIDRAAYLKAKFGDAKGAGNYERVAAEGRKEGLEFAFDRIVRTPNTVNAHRLIRRAMDQGRQDAMVEALFRAYFIDGVDVGNVDNLIRLAASAGLDEGAARDYLASDEDADAIRAADEHVRRLGVNGVPCFIIERKFAVSGAQPPEMLVKAFEQARREPAETVP